MHIKVWFELHRRRRMSIAKKTALCTYPKNRFFTIRQSEDDELATVSRVIMHFSYCNKWKKYTINKEPTSHHLILLLLLLAAGCNSRYVPNTKHCRMPLWIICKVHIIYGRKKHETIKSACIFNRLLECSCCWACICTANIIHYSLVVRRMPIVAWP